MNSRKRKGSPCQFDEFVYEKEAPRTFRAVNGEKPATDDSFFNDDMILKVRREVYSWMLKIVDSGDFDREIIYYAMFYFDRCYTSVLNKNDRDESKRKLQLLSMASLYLALKVHGSAKSAEKIYKFYFKHPSNMKFERKELFAMEMDILQHMKWKLNPATPQHFLYKYVDIISATNPEIQYNLEIFQEIANYILDNILTLPAVKSKRSSSLALASMQLALTATNPDVLQDTDVLHIKLFSRLYIRTHLPFAHDEAIDILKAVREEMSIPEITSNIQNMKETLMNA
jgi:hypothetical protein